MKKAIELDSSLKVAKNRGFSLRDRLLIKWHEIRINFVVGLTRERFSHGEVYVNGIVQPLKVISFQHLEERVKALEKKFHLKHLDASLLVRMWCSRKLIKIQSQDVKIEIVTYWYF